MKSFDLVKIRNYAFNVIASTYPRTSTLILNTLQTLKIIISDITSRVKIYTVINIKNYMDILRIKLNAYLTIISIPIVLKITTSIRLRLKAYVVVKMKLVTAYTAKLLNKLKFTTLQLLRLYPTAMVGRLRPLGEVDPKLLGELDNIDLGDLDFMVT